MRLPFSKLNDGLDNDDLIDEQGYPVEMSACERIATEILEYDFRLRIAIEENRMAFGFERYSGF